MEEIIDLVLLLPDYIIFGGALTLFALFLLLAFIAILRFYSPRRIKKFLKQINHVGENAVKKRSILDTINNGIAFYYYLLLVATPEDKAALNYLFENQPFELGDFVKIGTVSGTITKIDLQATWLKSLLGEAVIVRNHSLLTMSIHNYSKVQERGVEFTFHVDYKTPSEQLSRIPMQIQSIIEKQSYSHFERAHLASFGDSGFLFQVAYSLTVADYVIYMDEQQAINLALAEYLEQAGVCFASVNE